MLLSDLILTQYADGMARIDQRTVQIEESKEEKNNLIKYYENIVKQEVSKTWLTISLFSF